MTAKLPPAIQQKILHRRNSGARIIEIADELELSRHTVAGYCRIADQKKAIGKAPAATLTEPEVDRLREIARWLNLTSVEFQGLTELARRVRNLTCPNCQATVWALPTSAQVWCEGCSTQFSLRLPRTTVGRTVTALRGRQPGSTTGAHAGGFVPPRTKASEPVWPYVEEPDANGY